MTLCTFAISLTEPPLICTLDQGHYGPHYDRFSHMYFRDDGVAILPEAVK